MSETPAPQGDQTREQKLISMVALTLADPANVEDAEPGTEGHREPWEPWSAPVMVLAGYVKAQDDGGLMPWLYLACRCGWWLGYGTQYDPAKFAEVTQAHGERCELNPANGPLTDVPMVCTACRKPVHQVPGIWAPAVWAHAADGDARDCPERGAHLTGTPVRAMVEAGNENVPPHGRLTR